MPGLKCGWGQVLLGWPWIFWAYGKSVGCPTHENLRRARQGAYCALQYEDAGFMESGLSDATKAARLMQYDIASPIMIPDYSGF